MISFFENLSTGKRLRLIERIFEIMSILAVINDPTDPHIVTSILNLVQKLLVIAVKNDFVLPLNRHTLSMIEEINGLMKQRNDKKCKCKCKCKCNIVNDNNTDTDCNTSIDSSSY
jgi:hypothetical protein